MTPGSVVRPVGLRDIFYFQLPTKLKQLSPSRPFKCKLSNPLYGKSYKTDLERPGGKNDLKDPRFVVQHGDDLEFKMVTRSSDGQLMFLVNKLMKMKNGSRLGSRIAQVHNGSSLFTDDAGQGESNIRRWIFENYCRTSVAAGHRSLS